MKTTFLLLLAILLGANLAAQQKGEPFPNTDVTWQNGSDRRDSSVFGNMKHFVPNLLLDLNYTHSFNNPNDNTVVGSTALTRNNEVQLSALHFGGDFSYKNSRARVMLQFGTRSAVVPRNDYSVYRGQYRLDDVYRYLSEAYAGWHINKWYGINIDAGLFMSYIGLNSYYQAENWEYQASFTSDNTPWFFNGLRIQAYPLKHLKVEVWGINGWQSYGKFNRMPGVGANLTYMPGSRFKILTNDYFGSDAAGIPGRKRFHSDNSLLFRYFNQPESNGVSRAAISLTGDFGFEKGGGVNGLKAGGPASGPAQYFLSAMIYHRIWLYHNKLAITAGGGWMTNPGDPFKGWDASINLDFMPNQSMTIRLEFVHRESSVPYFAGRGGVTSQTGYTTTPLDPDWRPDLVKSESRIILAMLFRM